VSVVAFASVKASPGATTAMVAAGHVWPADRPVLLVEADPAGGDLAARFGLPVEPGLATLAAAGRRALAPQLVEAHVQQGAGLPMLVSPPTPNPARAALELLGGALGSVLAQLPGDALVDCGRLDAGSPALPLATAADLVLLVVRPTVVELPRVAARSAELVAAGCHVGLVLVGEASPSRGDRYPAAEVAREVGLPVVATLADDPAGAAVLAGQRGQQRALERCLLVRSARAMVAAILALLPEPAAAPTTWPSNGWKPTTAAPGWSAVVAR
jgi:Mrp family chromosome partitioning ATPase